MAVPECISVMVYLLVIFILGLMTPVQTAANSRLRQAVRSPLMVSLVSFPVGTFCLVAATLLQKGSLGIAAGVVAELPW